MCCDNCRVTARIFIGALLAGTSFLFGAVPFPKLSEQYQKQMLPLLERYCLDCHSEEEQEGELDLEWFATLKTVRQAPKVWVKVVEMMEDGEMPPKKKPQLTATERKEFLGWIRNYLEAEALANAGDPGRVVLRRLSNAEYTYTIQDLTEVKLTPAREFPVDGAAGEGFMNVGDAMAMSPALVQKYLDAAKEVASHAVLTPKGIRFSLGPSRREWADELLYEIRIIYDRHTSGTGDTDKVYAWEPDALDRAMNTSGRVDLKPYFAALMTYRDRLRKNPAVAAEVAREAKLNEKYFAKLTGLLVAENPSLLLRRVRDDLRTDQPDAAARITADVAAWKERLWSFGPVGQIGREGRPDAWMNAVNPVTAQQELRLKIPADAKGDISVFLAASDGGDGATGDAVRWVRPRVMLKDQPAIPLAAVPGLVQRMNFLQLNELARTEKYLAVIASAEWTGKTIEETAAGQGLDSRVLANWVKAVALGKFGARKVTGHYPGKMS